MTVDSFGLSMYMIRLPVTKESFIYLFLLLLLLPQGIGQSLHTKLKEVMMVDFVIPILSKKAFNFTINL